jgi:hypothetical protein
MSHRIRRIRGDEYVVDAATTFILHAANRIGRPRTV